MNGEYSQVIVSLVVLGIAVGVKIATFILLRNIDNKFNVKLRRKGNVTRIINLSLFFISGIILLGVWEVDPEDLLLYLASIFTVIGIAFFHQRSHLSNITAGIMLFFNHLAKVGDVVTIHDADDTIQGKIEDMGIIFITLLSNTNDKVMISNTVFLQKTVTVNQLDYSDKTEIISMKQENEKFSA